MVMYANDIETNGKQKLPEIKKLISSLDFLCYSIIKEHYEFGVAFNNNWLYMCKCSDPEAGFSIEGGTRRLIAAYFGIYSRLLCV